MRSVIRIIGRIALFLALLIALGVLGLLIFSRTQTFNGIVRTKLVSYLRNTYRGEIAVGKVEGSIWSNLVLLDVILSYRGQVIATIPRLAVGYSLVPLFWSSAHVDITAESPVLDLKRGKNGQWNLLEAFASRTPSGPSGFKIYLDKVLLRNGRARIAPEPAGPEYRLSALDADASVAILKSGTHAELHQFETVVLAKGYPELHTFVTADFDGTKSPQVVEIHRTDLWSGASALSIQGKIQHAQTSIFDVNVGITRIAAGDIVRIFPALPLKSDLSGTISVHGPENSLHGQLALASAGASLTGQVDTDLTQREPRFIAEARLKNADVQKLTTLQTVSAVLNGTLSAHGKAGDLSGIQSALNLHGSQVQVSQAYQLGEVDVSAKTDGRNVSASTSVAGNAGKINVSGSGSLQPDTPYRAKFMGRSLNLAAFSPRVTTPTSLNFDGNVDGRGTTLATMNARISGDISPSRVGPLSIASGVLRASIAKGRIGIERAFVKAQQSLLDVRGSVGIESRAPWHLVYQLQTANAASLLKLANVQGRGRLGVSGTVEGPPANLRTNGSISLTSFAAAGASLHQGEIRYRLVATGKGAPYGDLDAHITGFSGGAKLKSIKAQIRATPGISHKVAIVMRAQDEAGRNDALEAAITYRPNSITGQVTQIALGLPNGIWTLAAPFHFEENQRAVSISRMELRNRAREVVVEGVIARQPAVAQDFTMTMSQVDLAALRPFMPGFPLNGMTSAQVRITGTASAPIIDAETRARNLQVRSQRVGDFAAAIGYRAGSISIDANLVQNAQDHLAAAGTIPANLSWSNGFNARFAGPVDFRLNSNRLDLAQLAQLAPYTVRKFHGFLSINLAVRGTIDHPVPNGSMRVFDAGGEIVPLGVTLSQLSTSISVDAHEIRVTSFEMTSKDGKASAGGTIALNDYLPGALNLHADFDHWPAINTQQYQATIGGNLNLTGTAEMPMLGGRLEVLNGTIRPDLGFLLASSKLAPDETITIIPADAKVPVSQASLSNQPPPLAPPPVKQQQFNAFAMNVFVKIDRDTWIRHDQASAELEGNLHLTKDPHGPARISGTIRTVRGWLIYDQRKFTLQSGEINFTGGSSINPQLNIDARYNITNYVIDIIVTGTADKPKLSLTSQPALPQSDIVSLILFGKTTSALSAGQQASLQQQAAKMAAGAAASQIGQAVSNSLGLQGLGVEMNDVSTSGGTLGIGHYLGENTYVSASQTVGGTAGQKVSVQYFFLPWLSVTVGGASDGSHEIDLNLVKSY